MPTLRPYQWEAVFSTEEMLRYSYSALIVMATGTGKTPTLATIAGRWQNGRVLFLAHRDELIQQAVRQIHKWTGTWPAIEQSSQFSDESSDWGRCQIVVASVQSLHERRLTPDRFNGIGLVIGDEGHHAAENSKTWGRIFSSLQGKNPNTRFILATATPDRADGAKLLADKFSYKLPMCDALHEGWLVPIKNRIIVVRSLDLSVVGKSGADLNKEQLSEQLEAERPSYEIAASTIQIAGTKQVLGFTASVRQAELLSNICNSLRANSSAWVCGDANLFPKTTRRLIIERYQNKEIQFLWNCGIFTEGTDLPGVELLCMARPTSSTALYQQMLGRALRPLDGTVDDPALTTPELRQAAIAASAKPCAEVIDYVDNSRRHDLVSVCSPGVLGGRFSEAEIEEARKEIEERTARGEEEVDAERALAEARRRLEEEEERRRQQLREQVEVNVNYALIECDPFDQSEKGIGRKTFVPKGKPVTEKQAKWLVEWGIAPQSVNRKQAVGIINKIRQGKLKKRTPSRPLSMPPTPGSAGHINQLLLET